MSKSEHTTWRLIIAALALAACGIACASTHYGPGTPYAVRQATRTAMHAWERQIGDRNLFDGIEIAVWYDRGSLYPLTDGTCACTVAWECGYWAGWRVVHINARDYRWKRGDFGRVDKLCALDGTIMHELGHVIGIPDIPCGADSADPLESRDHWPTMYGRMWPGKLTLEQADYDAHRREAGSE